jgi:hypothetical protein
MAPRKPRLAGRPSKPEPEPVTVTRTSVRPAAARAVALELAGGDKARLITQPGGWVLIANHPQGIRRT